MLLFGAFLYFVVGYGFAIEEEIHRVRTGVLTTRSMVMFDVLFWPLALIMILVKIAGVRNVAQIVMRRLPPTVTPLVLDGSEPPTVDYRTPREFAESNED